MFIKMIIAITTTTTTTTLMTIMSSVWRQWPWSTCWIYWLGFAGHDDRQYKTQSFLWLYRLKLLQIPAAQDVSVSGITYFWRPTESYQQSRYRHQAAKFSPFFYCFLELHLDSSFTFKPEPHTQNLRNLWPHYKEHNCFSKSETITPAN